jgi:hypothetical protein
MPKSSCDPAAANVDVASWPTPEVDAIDCELERPRFSAATSDLQVCPVHTDYPKAGTGDRQLLAVNELYWHRHPRGFLPPCQWFASRKRHAPLPHADRLLYTSSPGLLLPWEGIRRDETLRA